MLLPFNASELISFFYFTDQHHAWVYPTSFWRTKTADISSLFVTFALHFYQNFCKLKMGHTSCCKYMDTNKKIYNLQVNMFSASLFINQALGWNIYFGILLQLALTAICTALGKLYKDWSMNIDLKWILLDLIQASRLLYFLLIYFIYHDSNTSHVDIYLSHIIVTAYICLFVILFVI